MEIRSTTVQTGASHLLLFSKQPDFQELHFLEVSLNLEEEEEDDEVLITEMLN